MENKPSTRAPATGDDTQALRSSTNALPKRPLVKSTPSKTSSLTRPTAASATKTTTTSGLSKPPTRPSTISSMRTTPSTSTLAAGHKKRASLASTDAATSGDEKKKTSGLSAKPKRMSLAPTTSTSTSRATAATAASRRSTIQSSPTSERKPFVRQSAASPTKTRTPLSTPSSRITPSTSSRTRPLASSTSSLRNAGTADGKKRLSTIPASPAVRNEARDQFKESALHSVPEASTQPTRPRLGVRQSTRSTALARKIREFEVVNQMLQVAMAQEGDEEEQEQVQSKAAVTIAKLKADLSQIVDQEAVEAQVDDVEIPEPSTGLKPKPMEGESITSNNDEVASLKEQLTESQEMVNTLMTDLEQLKNKVAVFSASAEEESRKVQEATEAIRKEHAEKVEELNISHKQEIEMLRNENEDELQRTTSSHAKETAAMQSELAEAKASLAGHRVDASEVEGLKSTHAKELEVLQMQIKESEADTNASEITVAALRSELVEAKANLARLDKSAADVETLKKLHAKERESYQQQTENAESKAASHEQDLSKLRAELDETRASLQQNVTALDLKQGNHDTAMRQLEEAKQTEINDAKKLHLTKMSDMQALLDQATQASTDTAAQQKIEISRLGQVIEKLQDEIQARDEANMNETDSRISDIKDEHEKAMSAALDAAKSSSSGEIEALRTTLTAEFQTTISDLRNELAKAQEQASKKSQDAEAASEEQIHALEAKVRNLNSEMESYKMQSQTFKQILSSSEKETQERDEEHAEAIRKLEGEIGTSVKKAAEQQMKVMDLTVRLEQEVAKRAALEKTHAKVIDDVEAELEATKAHHEEKWGSEIRNLKEQHAANLKDFRSKEEALKSQVDELQVKHDSMHQQLKAQEETHTQMLKDLQSKHDAAYKEVQDNAAIRQQELELLKTRYADAGESSAALVASHKQELEALQTKHDQTVREMDTKLNENVAELAQSRTQNATHSEAMKALEASHAEQVEQIIAQHSEGLSNLQSVADEKDAELAKMHAQYAEMVQKFEMSSRRDSEFEKLTIQNTNMATELKSIEASHSAYLEELRKDFMEEIKAAEAASKVHASELQRLKEQEAASKNAAELSKDAHVKEIAALKSQHADQLTKLQSASKDQAAELNKLKMHRGLAAEEGKAKEAAHSREIKELQAQHSATMEAIADAQVAEIERMKKQHSEAQLKSSTSEKAAEDLRRDSTKSAEALKEMQIKVASLEAELALSKKTNTPRSKSPKKKKSSKSMNGNGSPGLANSKWALAEPRTPLKQEYGTLRGGSADELSPAGATDISSTAPTPASAPRKHNIEGQLAGMQERLKHLDDIDAEMLEQHERMARTLSRVDDTTVSTNEQA